MHNLVNDTNILSYVCAYNLWLMYNGSYKTGAQYCAI